jgi:DNA primase
MDMTQIQYNGSPRLLVPIRDAKGVQIGNESKRIGESLWLFDKTKQFREKDVPWMGWFYSPNFSSDHYYDKVLIVEDVISAMRTSDFIMTACLLGTGLSVEKMQDIVKQTDNIILALDKDATEKAYVFKERWRFICPKMQVLNLQKDLKYLQDWEIQDLIDGVVFT